MAETILTTGIIADDYARIVAWGGTSYHHSICAVPLMRPKTGSGLKDRGFWNALVERPIISRSVLSKAGDVSKLVSVLMIEAFSHKPPLSFAAFTMWRELHSITHHLIGGWQKRGR